MPQTDTPAPAPSVNEKRASAYRAAALACLYGAAVAFTVACSPAVGLVDLGHPAAHQGHAIALQIWPGQVNR